MGKEAICPWCEKKTVPKMNILNKVYGNVRERRCTHCGKVLSAYLVGEGDFMGRIRKFKN